MSYITVFSPALKQTMCLHVVHEYLNSCSHSRQRGVSCWYGHHNLGPWGRGTRIVHWCLAFFFNLTDLIHIENINHMNQGYSFMLTCSNYCFMLDAMFLFVHWYVHKTINNDQHYLETTCNSCCLCPGCWSRSLSDWKDWRIGSATESQSK